MSIQPEWTEGELAAAALAALPAVRFEILPLKGVEAELAALPAGATATVTSSPSKGLEATLALCERVTAERPDVAVVPHLAARLVRDRGHVRALLRRLEGLGVREVFVVAGDLPEPAGAYDGAAALLREMADVGHDLARVGITGYPETHPLIADEDTVQAMAAKVPYATHIVSQICYDPGTIAGWVRAVRERGVALPIHLGVPGVVDRARLLRISVKVGLGDSVRFLRKQHGVLTRFVAGYTPEELLAGLHPLVLDPAAGVAGWHLFTFNEVAKTERWRQDLCARAQGAEHDLPE